MQSRNFYFPCDVTTQLIGHWTFDLFLIVLYKVIKMCGELDFVSEKFEQAHIDNYLTEFVLVGVG